MLNKKVESITYQNVIITMLEVGNEEWRQTRLVSNQIENNEEPKWSCDM